MLFIVVYYNKFLVCDSKLLEIYYSRGLKSNNEIVVVVILLFQKTTVVNLA